VLLRFVFLYRLPESSAKQRKRSAQRSRKRSSRNKDDSKSSMLYNTGVVTAVLDKYAIHHTQHDTALDGLTKHSNDITAHNSSECSDSVWHDSAVYNSLRIPVTVTAAKILLHSEQMSSTVQHNVKRCSAEQCDVQSLDTTDSKQHQDDDHSLHESVLAENKQDAVHDNNTNESDGAAVNDTTTAAIDNVDDTEVAVSSSNSADDELDTDSTTSTNNVGSGVNDIHTDIHEVVEAVPTVNQPDDDATVSINNNDGCSNISNSSHSTCSSGSSKHVHITTTVQRLQQTAHYSNTASNTLKQYPTAATAAATATAAVGQWAMATVKTRKKERFGSVTVRNRPKSAPAARRSSTASSSSSSNTNNAVERDATAATTGMTISAKQCTQGTQWDVKMVEVKARRDLRDQQLVSYLKIYISLCVQVMMYHSIT
jgi:hypothetical protein